MAIFRSCIPKIFLEEKNHPYKLKTSVRHEFKQVKNPALLKFNCSESVRHELKQVKNPALRPVSTTSVKKKHFLFVLLLFFALASIEDQ